MLFKPSAVASVCFSFQQIYDLVRFCVISDSLMFVDTTFNLGKFYVTVIAYNDLSLYKRGTNHHLIMIGPIMVHTRKTKEIYHHFASSINQFFLLNSELFPESNLNVKNIITDDDSALHGAFKLVFKESNFVLCCNHMKKDIKRILGHFAIDENEKQEVLFSIFGNKLDRQDALIYADSYDDYKEKLKPLLHKWQDYLCRTKPVNQTFKDWFAKHKLKKIYENIIKPNLDSLEKTYWTTNYIKSLNQAIKELKDSRRKYTFSRIHSFFEEHSSYIVNQSSLALRNAGNFELAREVAKLTIRNETWLALRADIQRKRINKFLSWCPNEKTENTLTSIYEDKKYKKNEE